MKICKDFDKPVASGYPVKLYHATVDIDGVCDNGLLPSCAVEKSALGQIVCDNNPLISFTYDKQIAFDIAKDLKTLIQIVNGEITPDNIREKLDEVDDEGSFITGKSHWIFTDTKPDPSAKYDVYPHAEGVYALQLEPDKMYYKEMDNPPSKIWDKMIEDGDFELWIDQIKDESETEEMRLKIFFDLWRHYLKLRDKYGGRHDPWFAVSSRPQTLNGIKPSDVGVVEVDAFLRTGCVKLHKRNSYDEYRCFDVNWKENDFTYDDPRQVIWSEGGEMINKEVRIPRERFTKLKVLPILEKPSVPKDVIYIPRMKKELSL